MAKKILVIEDNIALINLFKSILIEAGYKVEGAENGKIGLEKIEKFKPDLILLDILLPRVSGFEILKNLREIPSTYDLPVIVLSELGSEKNIKKCLELGAKDFLIKSNVHLEDILEKVKSVLGEKK